MSATVAPIDTAATIAAIDEEIRNTIDATEVLADAKPAKLTKQEQVARERAQEEAAREAERAKVQALVPWTVVDQHWMQSREIDLYFDDHGTYPRAYRAYSRAEWRELIATLATAVNALAETDPDYQRATGLYVEEHGDDILLLCAKKWHLIIQVPARASTSGKRFDLKTPPGVDPYANGGDAGRLASFAELLTKHLPEESRDMLLDICCQYLRPVRIYVNRHTWALANPELVSLMNGT